MKIGFLFLSILTMACTWWWAAHRRQTQTRLSWREKRRIAFQSLLAGIAVYFLLLMTAAVYLTLSA